jgi:hypothetical protein
MFKEKNSIEKKLKIINIMIILYSKRIYLNNKLIIIVKKI